MKLMLIRKMGLVAGLAICLVSGFWTNALFAKDDSIDSAVEKAILQSLRTSRPDLVFGPVIHSTVDGLYEVEIINGPTLYVTSDGKQFISGDLFSVEAQGFVNIAEQKRQKDRVDLLAAVDLKDMIVFAPEKTEAVIYVFTDIDCGFCQKLHREVPQLNEAGIEVRYLAFPRAGIGSRSYEKIVTAWCSVDRNATLTKMKNRQSVPNNLCKDNPVADQYKLGDQIGVRGTPALVLEDGTLVPGYRPAAELAQLLKLK